MYRATGVSLSNIITITILISERKGSVGYMIKKIIILIFGKKGVGRARYPTNQLGVG